MDTHFGQEKVEEDCVELAKEVEEDSDDSDALDMEDFDPDVDDLVVGTNLNSLLPATPSWPQNWILTRNRSRQDRSV